MSLIMVRLGKKKATSSLHALRRKITLEALARLQPILLLQMLVGISQTVNSSVSRSQTLARTLLLSGQQRLHDLLASAPRLHLSVEQMLEFCRLGDAKRTPEEAVAQALLEVCLGLMLQWMTENHRRRRIPATVCRRQRVSPSYFPLYSSRRLPRARSCLYVSLFR